MADALRARQHGIHELLGLERVRIAFAGHLEPFHRVAGRVLDAGDIDPADFFVVREHRRDVALVVAEPLELARQLDCVVDRELGARADGEMGGVGGVAHQHDMRAAVEMAPAPADQPIEVQPLRAALVAGVGHQLRAVERLGEQVLAETDRGFLTELVEAVRLVGLFGGLDDEGRGLVVELVDMGLEPAVFGLAEIEGEGVERFVRAEPDVAVRAHDEIGLKHRLVAIAHPGRSAVRSDDEVGVGKFEVGTDFALEGEPDAQRLAAGLQDVEELLAPDADEAVAGRADAPPLEQEFDVVPVVEGALDLGRRLRVPDLHRLHGRVGEHDAPPERVVRPVALDHLDVVGRVQRLHQQAEIEARGTAADANDAHFAPPYILYLNI